MPFSACRTTVEPAGQVVGDQRRQPDAEVDVLAVVQLARPRGRPSRRGSRLMSVAPRVRGWCASRCPCAPPARASARRPAARRRRAGGRRRERSRPTSTTCSASTIVSRPAMAAAGLKLRARRVEHAVAVPVGDRGADQREVGDDRLLEHQLAAVERRAPPSAARRPRPCRRRRSARAARPRRPACRRRSGCRRRRSRRRRRAAARPACPAGSARRSSSPARYCRANSLFSPTYERDRRGRSGRARAAGRGPAPSTPQLFDTTVRSLGALVEQRLDEEPRDAGQAEAADGEARPVGDVGHRLGAPSRPAHQPSCRSWTLTCRSSDRSKTAARPWPPPMHIVSRP